MRGERCVFLEPGDEKPADIQAWLREQGFDIDRPIQHFTDQDGWLWWSQRPLTTIDVEPHDEG